MTESLGMLIVASLAYFPYLLFRRDDLIYDGDIVVDKSPAKVLIFSGFMILLSVAALYQHVSQVSLTSIADHWVSRLLAGTVVIYAALLSLLIKVKGRNYSWIDVPVLVVAAVLSFGLIFQFLPLIVFGYGGFAIFSWIFIKYIGHVKLL